MPRFLVLAGCLLLSVGAAHAHVLKFATLAPEGSAWMNIIQDWAKQVDAESGGRLKFKIYPGGVAGDEPDVLRKIRFGQLQGAAITGHGIGLIYPPARALEMPFLFDTLREIDYVRDHLLPEILPEFRRNGFELLSWIEVGCVRLFSSAPIRSLDEMRQRRIWLWQGDRLAQVFFEVSGLAPIPLAITEVFTSLSTGLIDTVTAPPLAAVAMQWFTKTRYVTEPPMANGIGGLVIANPFFDRLPPDLQDLLRRTGLETGHRMIEVTRDDNLKSLEVLKERGLNFVRWQDGDEQMVLGMRDRAVDRLIAEGYFTAPLYHRVLDLLREYRVSEAVTNAVPCSR